MWRKQFLFFLFFLVIFFPMRAGAEEEKPPMRLARFPILVESSYGLNEEVLEHLEIKVDRAVHVPMNGILHMVEYLPEKECMEALEEAMAELRRGNRKARLRDAMKTVADRLQADIVVLPVLENYSQFTYMGCRWDKGSILCSDVRVVLMGYERKTDKPFHEAESRFYRNEYSKWGLAEVLAEECLDRVLERVNIYHMIRGE